MPTREQLARTEQTYPERWSEEPLTSDQVCSLRRHLALAHSWTAEQVEAAEGSLRRLHFEEHVELADRLKHGYQEGAS